MSSSLSVFMNVDTDKPRPCWWKSEELQGKTKRKNIGKCKVLSSAQSMGPLYVASVSMKWTVRFIFCILYTQYMWQGAVDSLAGIGTRYWMDDLGLEFRWGNIFLISPDRRRSPHRPMQNGCPVCSSRVKRPRRGANHSLAYSAGVENG
jgi:hypothetical protein